MKTACLLLLVLGTALAADPCCYPDAFVVGKGSVAGMSVHGKGASISSDSSLAFDYPNKKAAEIISVFEMDKTTKYHVIFDYNTGTQYTYDETASKCWKTPLEGEMEHCVNANATFYGEVYLGDKQMTVDNFGYFLTEREAHGHVSLSVTKGTCLPSSFIFLGVARGVGTTAITGYYNYVGSIDDPSKYFDIPAACNKALIKDLPNIYPQLGLGL